MESYYETKPAPKAFLWRRLQSFMGLFLVLFLIEHLLTNSQVSLIYGEDGIGFIHAVNSIHNLPYLPVVELTLIGLPFAIHIAWGIKYLFTSKQNAYQVKSYEPNLGKYAQNQAYTWQRITSWILVIAVISHVTQMRFMYYPTSAKLGSKTFYMMPVSLDDGLYTLSERLNITLVTQKELEKERKLLEEASLKAGSPAEPLTNFFQTITEIFTHTNDETITNQEVKKLIENQEIEQKKEWIKAIEAWPISEGQVVAVAPDFGTAELLLVRNTFKNPLMLFLYSIFVLAATYHAFNGLWTFMITWGVTLTKRSQAYMRVLSVLLMFLIGFLGLIAIWGSYLVNLNE